MMTDRAGMERAGYLESNDKIGRSIETGNLTPPMWAKIERGYIRWKGLDLMDSVSPSPDTFDNFIELWRQKDHTILEFAKTWGTLRDSRWHLSQRRKTTLAEVGGREPLKTWRSLSRHAWDLLQIAARLRSGDDTSFDQWSELLSEERMLSGLADLVTMGARKRHREHEGTEDDSNEWRHDAARYLDVEVISWNATQGPVSFGIVRDYSAPSGWRTIFDFGGRLPCYIGFQLMLVISGGDAFTCSACGKAYIRPRGRTAPKGLRKAPKPGQRNYCQSEECIREGNRLAAERYRKKDN
jgi:hypothetical protein